MVHKIEYCSGTSNPFTGCTVDCSFCYARKMAHRFQHTDTVYNRMAKAAGDPFAPGYHPDKLAALDLELHKARKPKRVFIGSMGEIAERERYETGRDGKHKRHLVKFHKNASKI